MAEVLSQLETRGYGDSAEEALWDGFDSEDEEACGVADDGALDERPDASPHHVGGADGAKVAKRVSRPLTIAERSEKADRVFEENSMSPRLLARIEAYAMMKEKETGGDDA